MACTKNVVNNIQIDNDIDRTTAYKVHTLFEEGEKKRSACVVYGVCLMFDRGREQEREEEKHTASSLNGIRAIWKYNTKNGKFTPKA